MKRVLAVSTFDYPSRFAHAIHGLEMARAFARAPLRFTFICNTAVNPSELSGIRYRRLFGPFGRMVKKLYLRRVLFIPAMIPRLLLRWPHVVYTTEPGLYAPLALLRLFFRYRLVAECHGTLTKRQARALARADKLVFTTEGLRQHFLATQPWVRERAVVVQNAADVARFDAITADIPTLRGELGLPPIAFLIGYIGRFEPLGADKGLHVMIDALPQFSLDTNLLLVGGAKQEIATYEAYADSKGVLGRVHFVPHVDPREVPRYAKACDCLVYIPPSNQFTEIETSPMKLFEYMAAERPMILSGTAAIRDIVRDDEAVFVAPDSLDEFVAAVTIQRNNMAEMRERARRAHIRVASMTWDKRAEKLLELVGH